MGKDRTIKTNEAESSAEMTAHHQCSKWAIRKRNVHMLWPSVMATIVVTNPWSSDVRTARPIGVHSSAMRPPALVKSTAGPTPDDMF